MAGTGEASENNGNSTGRCRPEENGDHAVAEGQRGTQELPQTPSVATSSSPQRVRFSIDTSEDDQHHTKQRKSNESLLDREHSRDDRSKNPGLAIDTRAANIMSGQAVRGEPIVGSSTATASPARSSWHTAPASPMSPKSRNRGLSLRTSLFTKNLDKKITSPTSAIEMHQVGSSSSSNRPLGQSSSGGKKDGSVAVTVSPVVEGTDMAPARPANPSEPFPKSGKGISALPNYQHWVGRHAQRHLPLGRITEAMERARKYILHIQDIPPSQDGRHVPLNPSRKKALVDDRTEKPYIDNFIRSSKYTAWNFLPRQLFAQFSKLANFYFLCVSILQMIPGLSTTGTYTTIVPLLFFVSISMAKEGYEDFRRYKADKEENNREAKVMHAYRPLDTALPVSKVEDGRTVEEGRARMAAEGPIHWASVKWHTIQVGDLVKLERDDACPADVVLIRSEGANNATYVETMALDGETNLKNKQPPPSLVKSYDRAEAIAAGGSHFVVEDPNLDLYNFEGKVTTPEGNTAPLTNNEVIYRGSILRNTPAAYGIVIYSGEECKIRMNANKNPRIKAPMLQAMVNKIVLMMVGFVLFLSFFNAIAYLVWRDNVEGKLWYLTEATVSFGPVITSFIIMFNTLIPLSLYVSMEIIKAAQQWYLCTDLDMYDQESDTPFDARTSTINEELGQVGYVFSDKTGTLTENVMRFRELSVAGTAWCHREDIVGNGGSDVKSPTSRRKGKEAADGSQKTHAPRRSTASAWSSPGRLMQPETSTKNMIRYLQRRPNTVFARKTRMMILSMAVCHTCLPERAEDVDSDESISYQASSPDELALVRAAAELGYVSYHRETSTLTLKIYSNGLEAEPAFETYEVLDVIEFSSKRKRMSVVVRFPDGRICLMSKGADSVIMERLRLAALANEKLREVEKRTLQRKSMEAHEAMIRKSMQTERQGSTVIGPTSIGRASMESRADVDEWLKERERDVDDGVEKSDGRYYSPRPSAQIRRSIGFNDSSIAAKDDAEELVEEALAMDDGAVIERCLQHINDFATSGLRTLLYGYRMLTEDEYCDWKRVYHEATTSLTNRQVLVEQAGDQIERDLELAGATAIEDKLQQGVPETIERLRRANIKLWMLTGDKRETAINIGHSCRLIKDYSAVTILDYEAGDVEQNIAATIVDIERGNVAHSVVVVDGQTLSAIESDSGLHTLFLDLAVLADSVVCCRASPSQKAGLVHAIRLRIKKGVTLAIGDGANDIAMIQEAHVGVGITGKEGLQAARTSDYSLAQFRFLVKLLLVHGRWNYVRLCKYTVGTFWKEMLFYLTQALYQRYAGYTGTSLYESWSLSMFNTLFTSLTIIFLGIFEQDLHASTLIAVPELYTKGQKHAGFNFKVYTGWMFMATSEAMIVYFTMWGIYGGAPFTRDQTLYPLGDLTFTVCVIVISLKLQVIEQRYRSYMAAIALVLSVGGWFLWNIILAAMYSPDTNPEYYVKGGFFNRFGRNPLWWLTILLSVAACMLFEICVRALKNVIFPTDVEVFQTLEQDSSIHERFDESAAPWLQAARDKAEKKSSLDLEKERKFEDLLNRPSVVEEGRASGGKGGVQTEEEAVLVDDGSGGNGTDIQEMLSQRFGSVKGGDLVSP